MIRFAILIILLVTFCLIVKLSTRSATLYINNAFCLLVVFIIFYIRIKRLRLAAILVVDKPQVTRTDMVVISFVQIYLNFLILFLYVVVSQGQSLSLSVSEMVMDLQFRTHFTVPEFTGT